MTLDDISNSMIDFSKTLLVTLFAIFAFTSHTLLGTQSCLIKIVYLISLGLAIYSLHIGFKGILVRVNYFLHLNIDADHLKYDANIILPSGQFKLMKKYFEQQLHCSVLALICLVISVSMLFFGTPF